MEFKYPSDIVQLIRKRWNTWQKILNEPDIKNKKSNVTVEFPSNVKLKYILDVIYHASFLTEESKRIILRVGYMSQSNLRKNAGILNMHNEPIALLKPVPFSVSELLKISPSLDPNQSILLICEGKKTTANQNSNDLFIWGIIDLGLEWWENITGLLTGATCPPNILTLSSNAPGNLTATTIGSVLLRLSSGKLLDTPLEDLSLGIIGKFLESGSNALYKDAIKKLKIKRYSIEQDSDQHPYQMYFRTINNILNFAKEKSHGATFIIIPEEIQYNDTRLTDRINLKYIFNKEIIWDELVRECEANYHYYELLFPNSHKSKPIRDKFRMITESRKATAKDLKEVIKWNDIHDSLEKSILDFERFVAQLSCVDGAVILSNKLRILGYGGEITAQSSSLNHVFSANDPSAKSLSKVDINNFGTRHRSAFRFCSSFDNSIAFVISQDGGIKAIKREGPSVFLWNYVNLGDTSI